MKSRVDSQDSISIYSKIDGTYDQRSFNIWSKGLKSPYYHLLPAKGNYEILEQINQDIKNNLLYDDNKENDKNTNNVSPKKKKSNKKKEIKIFRKKKSREAMRGLFMKRLIKKLER